MAGVRPSEGSRVSGPGGAASDRRFIPGPAGRAADNWEGRASRVGRPGAESETDRRGGLNTGNDPQSIVGGSRPRSAEVVHGRLSMSGSNRRRIMGVPE